MDPDIEQNKEAAAVSYFWIFSILMYITRRRSPFVRFHAKQAMLLFGLSIIFWYVPYIGRFLELLVLTGSVVGFLNAIRGKRSKVPLIGFVVKNHDKETI